MLARYLRADLQRIANRANDELTSIRRSGVAGLARQAQEARVINDARALAARRVESTVRQVRELTHAVQREDPGPQRVAEPVGRDFDKTEVIPVIAAEEVAVDAPDTTEQPESSAPPAVADEPVDSPPAAPLSKRADTGSGNDRLQRLLAFVARQEPRLNWAVGDCPDGMTMLVTDLAHVWIPPGIKVPAGVRLLEPGYRTAKLPALLGDSTQGTTYSPGDPLAGLVDLGAAESSLDPRQLPLLDDLGWELGQATHWRDGLPGMVHTLVKAAASATGVVEEEVDLLRVHVDTATHQLVVRSPDVDAALLLNCLLLAAAEAFVTGDVTAANYHFAWFQKLNAPPAG